MSDQEDRSEQTRLRVLTIDQPYASLVALGAKWIETRPNRTHVRGRIAIHASAKVRGRRGDWTEVGRYEIERDASGYMLRGESLSWPYRLPTGAIVATAELYDCVPMVDFWSLGGHPYLVVPHATLATTHSSSVDVADQMPFGNFASGRWAWLLRDVQRINPVPFIGGQGWSRTWAVPS